MPTQESSLRTVLITGANKGLGFDSARQLAETGRWRVIVGARSQAKAEDAIERLQALTGQPRERFGEAIFDNNLPKTIRFAVTSLARQGETLDAVVLNAGGVPNPDAEGRVKRTRLGLTQLFSMNVTGHAILIEDLLDTGVLATGATVMFAGSEASRGIPVMGMKTPTLPSGYSDLDETLRAVATGAHFDDAYDPMHDYGLVKLIGTVWMRQLRDRHGLRALTISPGFTAGTDAMSDLPLLQRILFAYIMLPLLKFFGNAHALEFGARRYVQALEDRSLVAGSFYASPGSKISGPLAQQTSAQQPLLGDTAFQAAVGRVLDAQVSELRAQDMQPIAVAS